MNKKKKIVTAAALGTFLLGILPSVSVGVQGNSDTFKDSSFQKYKDEVNFSATGSIEVKGKLHIHSSITTFNSENIVLQN